MRRLAVALLLALVPSAAFAEEEFEGGFAAAPANPAFTKECSACHIAFPAVMLPSSSWKAIMGSLDDHFGENAALDDATRAEIEAYLTANSADGRVFATGVDPAAPPLRITETPWWKGAHRGIREARFTSPKVGSKANCAACHGGAASGLFEDED